jgi:hypothetical protein
MPCAQGVESSVSRALDVVSRDEGGILKDVPPANQAAAKAALAGLKKSLQQFKVVVDNKDKQEVRLNPWLRACGGVCACKPLTHTTLCRCPTSSRRRLATSRRWRRPWWLVRLLLRDWWGHINSPAPPPLPCRLPVRYPGAV